MHWDRDWDWDWHYDHHWHKPWNTHFYHYKCPLRKRFWSSLIDFDWDIHHFDCCHNVQDWCHRSCLTDRVYIETGKEDDSCGKGTYRIAIDVHHFKADELKLKVKNTDTLILEGQHKDDRANKMMPALCITRSFIRKYKLPRNYDATLSKATLSKDGIISIIVPAPPDLDDVEREIEIVNTETYFGAVEKSKQTKALEEQNEAEPSTERKKEET